MKKKLVSPGSRNLEESLPKSVRTQMASNRKLSALRAAISKNGGVSAKAGVVAKKANVATYTALPELASNFSGPAGSVVHIPIQVGTSAGNRISLFRLGRGRSTVSGLYVVSGAVYTRVVTRKTGTGALKKGDQLDEKIVNSQGKTVQQFSYIVSGLDSSTGAMRLSNSKKRKLETGDIVNGNRGWCWFCNANSSWWCGFPCFPDFGDDEIDEPITV
jgi:hypothetical protein